MNWLYILWLLRKRAIVAKRKKGIVSTLEDIISVKPNIAYSSLVPYSLEDTLFIKPFLSYESWKLEDVLRIIPSLSYNIIKPVSFEDCLEIKPYMSVHSAMSVSTGDIIRIVPYLSYSSIVRGFEDSLEIKPYISYDLYDLVESSNVSTNTNCPTYTDPHNVIGRTGIFGVDLCDVYSGSSEIYIILNVRINVPVEIYVSGAAFETGVLTISGDSVYQYDVIEKFGVGLSIYPNASNKITVRLQADTPPEYDDEGNPILKSHACYFESIELYMQ